MFAHSLFLSQKDFGEASNKVYNKVSKVNTGIVNLDKGKGRRGNTKHSGSDNIKSMSSIKFGCELPGRQGVGEGNTTDF